jgi:hypothetical protein
MVLKVYETFSAFTVSLIYLLYSLFNQVLLSKPYASSFAAHSQYIVCNGLRKRKPSAVIEMLQKIKNGDSLYSILDPECLEDEDNLRKYVLAHNEKLATVRVNLYQRAQQG